MGRPKKYDDFIVSAPYLKDAKHAGWTKRYYVKIRCPHCETDFKEVAESIIVTQKASECIEHLRVCKPAAAAGVRVKPRQGGTETAVREQTDVMREQHAESIAVQTAQLDVQRSTERTISNAARKLTAICEALGISDHSSDDDERIVGRGKRKLDEVSAAAESVAFKRVADAARLSPPRDGEEQVAIGERVVQGVALNTTEAAKVPRLKGYLKDVHQAVRIPSNAPPATRIDAVRTAVSKAEKLPTVEDKYEKLSQQVTDHNARLCAALGCGVCNEEQLEAIWKLVDTKAPKTIGFNANQLESVKMQIGKDGHLARACKVMRSKVQLKEFCNMLDKVTPDTEFNPDKGRYNSR
jgi:hypothetical protein